MKVIGVTGGVGAGKSMVLEILEKEYGAVLLPADEIGRRLMEPGAACYGPVIKKFGEAVRGTDGRLDRRKISDMVFGNTEALKLLNEIIHPAVRSEIEYRLEKGRNGNHPVQISVIESAILLEAGYEDICDEIWYVYASEETRIGRLMKNRGYTRERCIRVMENQMKEAGFRERAAAVIENEGCREWVQEQIGMLLKGEYL